MHSLSSHLCSRAYPVHFRLENYIKGKALDLYLQASAVALQAKDAETRSLRWAVALQAKDAEIRRLQVVVVPTFAMRVCQPG